GQRVGGRATGRDARGRRLAPDAGEEATRGVLGGCALELPAGAVPPLGECPGRVARGAERGPDCDAGQGRWASDPREEVRRLACGGERGHKPPAVTIPALGKEERSVPVRADGHAARRGGARNREERGGLPPRRVRGGLYRPVFAVPPLREGARVRPAH